MEPAPLFDTVTIFVMASLLYLVLSVALFMTWRLNKNIPGTLDWAIGSGTAASGTWLVALVRTDVGLYAGVLSKMALIYGLYRLWRGARLFYGRSVPAPSPIGVLAVILLVGLIYVSNTAEAPIAARLFISGPLGTLFFFLLAYEFFRAEDDGNRPTAALMTSVAYFLYGWITILRTSMAVIDYPDVMSHRTIDQVPFLLSTILVSLFGYGMVLITVARLHNNLARQAAIDPLTEVFNRRAFHDLQKGYLAHARRENEPVALSMVDLDHFKSINDTHGHDMGDAVLVQTVDRIKDSLRSEDVVARFGGEEFVILHPKTSIKDAEQIAERVRKAIESEPFTLNGTSISVTASIGITGSIGPDDIEALTKAADVALYEAKNGGRNRVVTQVPDAIAVPA